MSIQDDIKKDVDDALARWLDSCKSMDSEPAMDFMASELLNAVLFETIRAAVAKGLDVAAKECEQKAQTTKQLGFVPAYTTACDELSVIIKNMADRVKKGEYEHPVSDVGHLDSGKSNDTK
jgi:hypothetical protein